jgi:hypothetical protein
LGLPGPAYPNDNLTGIGMRLSGDTSPTTDCANSIDLINLAFGDGTSNNNGNVLSQTIVMPKQAGGTLTLSPNYGYDGVNRLASVGETVAGDDDGASAGPADFAALRSQWEYAYAARGAVQIIVLGAIVWSVLVDSPRVSMDA